MLQRKPSSQLFLGLLAITIAGCADTFLGAGSFLSTLGDGLTSVGTCLSPLTPVDLNEVLTKAPAITWSDGSAEITDASQPDVQAYLEEQLRQDIAPMNYQALRFYQIGPLSQGDLIEIKPLGDVLDFAALYDADLTLIPAGSVHDFEGNPRTLQVPIKRDTSVAYLRLDLMYLSETDRSIARLARQSGVAAPTPRTQTVVLHFGGQEGVTYRNGYLIPANIGSIDDSVVRQTVVDQFRDVYAPYNLTVLTDEDTPPEAPYSVIYIGATDLSVYNYGLAEQIDNRNLYLDDIAIVDANQIALELARVLGPVMYGRALAMIAAHEMGHLLGLEHVTDSDALMTGIQCQGTGLDVERMLQRQFKKAPILLIYDDLQQWTLGYQDAASDLLEILGPTNNELP